MRDVCRQSRVKDWEQGKKAAKLNLFLLGAIKPSGLFLDYRKNSEQQMVSS